VPFARAVNPISKTNWEGAGVEPDVPVKAADALEKAEELAASKLAHRSEKLAQTSLRLYSI
jgi:C-terminal processing protease CtpA/Prc